MANDKNKKNELVPDDEDATAELEAVTFRRDYPLPNAHLRESDENTCGFAERDNSDAKTISKLQYDMEQLRAKWLGVEAEIRAREELTDKLNGELDELRDSVSRKTKLIKDRDQKVKALKSEIREREEHYRNASDELRAEVELAREATREIPEPPAPSPRQSDSSKDDHRLPQIEAYADSLRHKLQDTLDTNDLLVSEHKRILAALKESGERNRRLTDELKTANIEKSKLDDRLAEIDDKHAEEIRILRFELGEAQDTISQTEDITYQLASDLVDTRSFKEELERMLHQADEESRARIEELEADMANMTRTVQHLEEQLESRTDAVNVLLKELARQSEQVESIGEIGDVVSDIDDHISDQFDKPDESPNVPQKASERVTRVLVGKIGDQLLRFPLFKDRLTIGRTSDNDIQLNAHYVSRRHAVVQADGEATRVIDWGSKNGVYVNSMQITEHFLQNGDIVTIGNAHFRYEERPKRDG